MHAWVRVRLPVHDELVDEWVDGELTTDHKAGFPVVDIDGRHYRPCEVVSIRVGEIVVPPVLLKMAKEAGFKVEEVKGEE